MENSIPVNEKVEIYKKFKTQKQPKLGKLFTKLGFTPNPFQKEVIKQVDENYKNWHNIMFACARRSGKSLATSLVITLEMLIPYASVVLVSPSNKQLGIVFDEVLKHIRKLGLPIEKLDTNGKMIRLENGATFRGGSESTITNLEGFDISLLAIDECFLIPSIKKILNSLSPALSTYGIYEDTRIQVGKIIMLGSVKNNLEAKYYYDKGMRRDKGYVTLRYTALDNPLLSKEFLEAERERLGEEVFRQEYLCEFVFSFASKVFKYFDVEKHVKDLSLVKTQINNDTNNIFALDVGATDKTSFLIIYYEAGKYYVIDGFEISESSERLIAQHIKELLAKYNLELSEYSFIDPSAKLTRLGLVSDYDLSFYPAKNDVKEGITVLNDLFRQDKLFVDKELGFLIKQIDTLEWKSNYNGTGDPFKRVEGHHFDSVHSMRYGIFTHYKMNTNTEIVVL